MPPSVGFAIIYYKLGKYGSGLWISAIAGVLIVLLSMLVFGEECTKGLVFEEELL